MDFLKDYRLDSLVVYVAERVWCAILHNAMLSFAKQLTSKFLENYLGLDTPHARAVCDLFDPLIKRETRLPDKLVNLKCNVWIVFMELLTSFWDSLHHVDLNLFKNLFVCLSCASLWLLESHGVLLSFLFEDLDHFDVYLGVYDWVNVRVVEKCNFPIVLLETLWELLKERFSNLSLGLLFRCVERFRLVFARSDLRLQTYVRRVYKWFAWSGILLYQDFCQNYVAGSFGILLLFCPNKVDHVNKTRLQALLVQLRLLQISVRGNSAAPWVVRWRDRLRLWCILSVNLLEQECKYKRANLCEPALTSFVKVFIGSFSSPSLT